MTALQKSRSRDKSYRTPEHYSWESMITRCNNPKHEMWEHYGGRGIKVCERWRKFVNFFADMGPKPTPKHTIDRVDTNGDYEPGNCRWATQKEQQRHRSNNRIVTFNGETKCVAEWAEIFGLNKVLIYLRIQRGWPVERLFIKPLKIIQGLTVERW